MAKVRPAEFIKQVKQEFSKVTWPTRRETVITTIMVFILVTLAAIFFSLVDTGLSFGVKAFLGIGW